jgi:hypothetical protein
MVSGIPLPHALAWLPSQQIGDELSFLFEPLCATAVTEPAELIAVFVADDGATLTTFIE